jgi:hypothetical protein
MSFVKYWELIADDPSKAGWSWGCVVSMDSEGRDIFIVDAYQQRKAIRCVCGRKADSVPLP